MSVRTLDLLTMAGLCHLCTPRKKDSDTREPRSGQLEDGRENTSSAGAGLDIQPDPISLSLVAVSQVLNGGELHGSLRAALTQAGRSMEGDGTDIIDIC